MTWINANWTLFLLACAVVGAACTGLALRVRAARIHRRLSARVATGELIWGAQVRRRLPDGRWGVGGELTLNSQGELRFEPSSSDLKRGAHAETWTMAKISYDDHRRDITGISLDVLTVTPEHGSPQKYGATNAVGTLPGKWVI